FSFVCLERLPISSKANHIMGEHKVRGRSFKRRNGHDVKKAAQCAKQLNGPSVARFAAAQVDHVTRSNAIHRQSRAGERFNEKLSGKICRCLTLFSDLR